MPNLSTPGGIDVSNNSFLCQMWVFSWQQGISCIFCTPSLTKTAIKWEPLRIERSMIPFWKLRDVRLLHIKSKRKTQNLTLDPPPTLNVLQCPYFLWKITNLSCILLHDCPAKSWKMSCIVLYFDFEKNLATMGGQFKCIFSHLRQVSFKIFSNHGEQFKCIFSRHFEMSKFQHFLQP